MININISMSECFNSTFIMKIFVIKNRLIEGIAMAQGALHFNKCVVV